jgi:protein TonB
MALSDFIGPFIIALIIHALVLSSDMFSHDAQLVMEKGASSITLNIVPSVTSRALQSPPMDDVPDISQRSTKTGTKEESSRQISEPPQISDANRPARADRGAPEEKSTQEGEQEIDRREQAPDVVDTEHEVMENPLRLQEELPADVGDDLETGGDDGDVSEQGERLPASVVGLVKPAYPRFSRIRGEEGTVVLLVEVLAEGRPGKIEIASSSGYRRLDRAALEAVGRARFIAAKINGRAVDSAQRIAFRFDLHD